MCDSIFSFPVQAESLELANIYASGLHPDGIEDSEEKSNNKNPQDVFTTQTPNQCHKVLVFSQRMVVLYF